MAPGKEWARMNEMAEGIAHISFAGGGMFLPARNSYDRQMLAEHVGERARAKGQVQVLMGERRWMVRRTCDSAAVRCALCGLGSTTACYSKSCEDICYCVGCALARE
jgi:hypothetical protein